MLGLIQQYCVNPYPEITCMHSYVGSAVPTNFAPPSHAYRAELSATGQPTGIRSDHRLKRPTAHCPQPRPLSIAVGGYIEILVILRQDAIIIRNKIGAGHEINKLQRQI